MLMSASTSPTTCVAKETLVTDGNQDLHGRLAHWDRHRPVAECRATDSPQAAHAYQAVAPEIAQQRSEYQQRGAESKGRGTPNPVAGFMR